MMRILIASFIAVMICVTSAHHPSAGAGNGHRGYSLGIRDSIMIAHSFEGQEFGPAQQMHGATYTVDAEFKADALVEKSNWVVDIGAASEMLSSVLSKYNFKNLNELFPGENTTTEFMCKVIFDELVAKCGDHFHGTLCIKLWESHKAWACYEGLVGEEDIRQPGQS
ncbi:unnamed protein product [Ascophyllum nodosum]